MYSSFRELSSMFVMALTLSVMYSCAISTPTTHVPNYQGCVASAAVNLPYCNGTLPLSDRINDIMSRLTLIEKISLISPDPSVGNDCEMMTAPVDRIGLPAYMWLTETNTGISSDCIKEGVCATTFASPSGLAASFNRTSWLLKGRVMSTEMRAFSNANWHRFDPTSTSYIGFTGFGPNLNIVRDPRFGRNCELPSEDPLLSGVYGSNMVQGMQEEDSVGHPRMLAYLKHFTAYSVEDNRGHDNYGISQFDFYDTYLSQYKIAMVEGKASGVMCSYNAENDYPSCANGFLLNDVMRTQWNRPDSVVMTDCGVLGNMMGVPVNAPTEAHASAWIINNGTDLEAGNHFWSSDGRLMQAINMGLTSESVIDTSVRRILSQHFKAGRFDSVASVEWNTINPSVINSVEHQNVNYENTLQSLVLLKNSGKTLPLTPGKKIAVVGPHAVSRRELLEDYFGDRVCYSAGPDRVFDCIENIAEAITKANVGGITTYAKGVEISNSTATDGIAAALKLVNDADIVVLALGLDTVDVEHEGTDRSSISLPGLQESFAKQVLATGKPVILILIHGGAVAIDSLVDGPRAIIDAFYPSTTGAKAIASTIFGGSNRWGKLPITIYPASYITEQSMTNFDMSVAPGRTYRYYQGKPLWSFGFGLSYSTFAISVSQSTQWTTVGSVRSVKFTVVVSCDGPDGDEVVQVYHRVGSDVMARVDHPVPSKQLIGFDRVSVKSGGSATLTFEITEDMLSLTDKSGERVVYPGLHQVVFSTGAPAQPDVVRALTI